MGVFFVLANSTIKRAVNESDFVGRLDWILPVILNVTLIFLTLWIIMSLLHYGIKTRKWKINEASAIEKLNAGIVYTFAVVCSIFCLFYLVSDQIFMNLGDDRLCEAAADAGVVMYSMILWSVFMFWWFRQKAFYTNKVFASKLNNCVKFASLSSIAMITISGGAYTVLFSLPKNYKATKEGCVLGLENESVQISFGLYAVVILFFSHFILVCLFIYPLLSSEKRTTQKRFGSRKKKKKNKIKPIDQISAEISSRCTPARTTAHSDSSYSRSSLSLKPPRKDIWYLLRKTFILALLSTVMDVSNQILCFFFEFNHRRFHCLLFDLSAFLNLLFLVLSFSTFKNILMSLVKK